MKRILTTALCVGIAVLATFGLAATPADAKTTIKIGHGANESFHMHRALVEFKRLVEEGSKGDIEVQIFPSSQMGPDREMIEGVQGGVLEMAVPPSSFFASWDPAFSVIELPFMYPNKATALATFHSPTGDAMLKRLDNLGLVGLGWLENGLRHVTNNVREIKAVDDLRGIKLRTMQVPAHVDTFKALGANPTPMNFGEVYSALQQRVIDGEENPIAHIFAQRFYEVQKYMTLTGHVFTVYVPVINKAFFEGLPADTRKLLRDSMRKAETYQQALVDAEEADQLEQIKKAGVQVTTLSVEQVRPLMKATAPVRDAYREKIGPAIYDGWATAIDANTK